MRADEAAAQLVTIKTKQGHFLSFKLTVKTFKWMTRNVAMVTDPASTENGCSCESGYQTISLLTRCLIGAACGELSLTRQTMFYTGGGLAQTDTVEFLAA